MKIGLIYFSHTGHTAIVAEQLTNILEKAGHQVISTRLETCKPLQMSATHAAIKEAPTVESFDAVIVGTPVHGSRISAPVLTWLERIPSLSEKKVSFFLTHFFPCKWGAVQTIEALDKICSEKGAVVLGSADVTWLSLSRKKQIHTAVSQLHKLL